MTTPSASTKQNQNPTTVRRVASPRPDTYIITHAVPRVHDVLHRVDGPAQVVVHPTDTTNQLTVSWAFGSFSHRVDGPDSTLSGGAMHWTVNHRRVARASASEGLPA